MTALFNDVLMLLFEGMTRGSIEGGTNQLTLITITNHSDGKKNNFTASLDECCSKQARSERASSF